jgi:hypothetical protein
LRQVGNVLAATDRNARRVCLIPNETCRIQKGS